MPRGTGFQPVKADPRVGLTTAERKREQNSPFDAYNGLSGRVPSKIEFQSQLNFS